MLLDKSERVLSAIGWKWKSFECYWMKVKELWVLLDESERVLSAIGW